MSLRHDVLSFQHSREVAALPPDEADALRLVRGNVEATLNARIARRGFAETRENWRGPQELGTDLPG